MIEFSTKPLQFDEAVAYFSKKKLVPSSDYREIWHLMHARSFTVARSAGFDFLGDIQGALLKATKGQSNFEIFKAEMEPLLRKKGWFQSLGMDSVGTADTRRRNRRLWTIYNTNMKTTVSAGRWAQAQRLQNNGVDMYFEYIQTTSENARSEHLLWVGTILPMTHTFWNKAYPPNGWGCKCSVATHTKYSLQSKKLQVTNAPELIEVDWLNKHTGQVQKVTRGVDPAFDYNVGFGYDKNLRSFESGRWDRAGKVLRETMLRTVFDNVLFASFITRERQNLHYKKRTPNVTDTNNLDYMPIGYVAKDIQTMTDVKTGLVYMSGAGAGKQRIAHPDLKPSDYAIVQEIFNKGAMVGNTANKNIFIGYIEKDGKGWKAVWKTAPPYRDELWFSSLTKVQLEQIKLRKYEYWIRK